MNNLSDKQKKIAGIALLLVIVLLVVLFFPFLSGGEKKPQNSNISYIEYTGDKIDLSKYKTRMDEHGKIRGSDTTQIKEVSINQLFIIDENLDSDNAFAEFIQGGEIDLLPQPDIYIRRDDGTLEKVSLEGSDFDEKYAEMQSKIEDYERTNPLVATKTTPKKTTTNTSAKTENVRTSVIKENTTPQIPADDKEARRRAMQESWGQVSTNNSQTTIGTKDYYSATIFGTQTIRSGQTVKFRVMESMKTNENREIPKNTIIYGVVNFSQNRATVSISSVKVGTDIIIANILVYGSDGMLGFPIGVDETMQQLGTSTASQAINQVGNVASSAGGAVGAVVGAVVRQVGTSVSQQKTQELMFIDNQSITLKIK